MLSEEEFFHFVEKRFYELTGYADAQVEAGNSRKDLDELINGYPACDSCGEVCDSWDQATYKIYAMLSERYSASSETVRGFNVDFYDFVSQWDKGYKSHIQKAVRQLNNDGYELTPLQLMLCSSALLQEN